MVPNVTFITPAFNATKTIGPCIESIFAQKCTKTVIVIDNNSTDSTAEQIKRYKSVKYLFEEQPGAGAARNLGLRFVNSDFVAFVDSDVILPDKDWINRCLANIKDDVIACGGPGRAYQENEISKTLSLHYGNVNERSFVNILPTMDMVIKTEMIKDHFFEPLLMRGEDPEFCFRLIEKGYKLFFSNELWVYHNHPTHLGDLLFKWYRYGEYYLLPYLLHRSQINLSVIIRVLFIPVLLVSLFISITNPRVILFPLSVIFGMYLIYLWTAYKIRYQGNKLIFGGIQTLKQVYHTIGIFRSLFKKITLKALVKGQLR